MMRFRTWTPSGLHCTNQFGSSNSLVCQSSNRLAYWHSANTNLGLCKHDFGLLYNYNTHRERHRERETNTITHLYVYTNKHLYTHAHTNTLTHKTIAHTHIIIQRKREREREPERDVEGWERETHTQRRRGGSVGLGHASVIGEKLRTKVYILKSKFKVCALWLPRYVSYSIEAKTSRIHKDGRR